jgi:hypothetical protein
MNPAIFWFGVWGQATKLWLRLPAAARDDDRASECSET